MISGECLQNTTRAKFHFGSLPGQSCVTPAWGTSNGCVTFNGHTGCFTVSIDFLRNALHITPLMIGLPQFQLTTLRHLSELFYQPRLVILRLDLLHFYPVTTCSGDCRLCAPGSNSHVLAVCCNDCYASKHSVVYIQSRQLSFRPW